MNILHSHREKQCCSQYSIFTASTSNIDAYVDHAIRYYTSFGKTCLKTSLYLVMFEEEEALNEDEDKSERCVEDEEDSITLPDVWSFKKLEEAECIQHGATQAKSCNRTRYFS